MMDITDPSHPASAVTVIGLASTVSAMCVGSYHTCALLTTGGVQCFGYNYYGQLGDGTTVNPRLTPVFATGLTSGVTAITCGLLSTCALQGTAVKCWGNNERGAVGDGTITSRSVPTGVLNMGGGVAAVSMGSRHTCSMMLDGPVYCWGINDIGELGDGAAFTDSSYARFTMSPGLVAVLPSGRTVTQVVASVSNTCVVADGGVYCWGDNLEGQLGDNTTTARPTASAVLGVSSAYALAWLRCAL